MTNYQFQKHARLMPLTKQFKGGRITDTDVLTLDDAAKYASKHADDEVTPADFLRAAARGEITLRAIVHREAKLQKHDGGIYCNQGEPTENTAPKGAIPTLPLSACQQLANAGRASWRTIDGFEQIDGELMRFTVATLIDSEPDFETVLADCRVMGDAVHALADTYIDTPTAPSGAPEKAAPPAASSDWRNSARAIADECFDNDTANKCRDSLAGYCRRVMDEMQARNIHGPRGLIDNPGTIQREALQGKKWWAGKTK